MKCNGIGGTDLSVGCFLFKPLKRFYLIFRFHSAWFKPWAMKCNGIGGTDLSVGCFLTKPLKRFYLIFRFHSAWLKTMGYENEML